MEEKQMDLEAPLLSVRRFSARPSASSTLLEEEEGEARPPPPRRVSLPYYKSDLKSGPVRVPEVVPFVWEQTPELPKNGAGSAVDGGGKVMMLPKLSPGRIQNGKGGNSLRDALAPAVKVGSSVRTRKAVTFAPDAGTANSYESSEDVPKIVVDERVEKMEKEDKVENADRIEMPVKAENMEEIEVEETVEKEERIEKAEKVEKKLEKQPVSASENHNKEDDVEEDTFSDAPDTLSRSESFFMNCSVSGISGIPDVAKLSGSFLKDPELRDFMIERFLPAAQAMTSDSPHYTFKKSAAPPRVATKLLERAETSDAARRPVPIPLQKNYTYPEKDAKELEEEDTYDEDNEDDEDEECYDDTGHFPSKGCGFLPQFCLKSSFCLLNPVPGMKVRGRHLPPPRGKFGIPQIKNAYPVSLVQVEELSWEAVYGKKIGQEHAPKKEVIGKLRSESDTLTADCSSAFGNSAATGGTTPDKNDGHPSTVHERKDSVGILSRESNCSKIGGSDAGEQSIGSYREINHSNRMSSESVSSLLDKTLRVDSGDRPGSSDSKASSFYTVNDTRNMMSSGEIGIDSWSRESVVAGANKKNALQPEVTKVSMPISLFPSEKLSNGKMDVDDNRNCGNDSKPLHLKSGINPLLSLLPPPLPKSPSESWLSRTLPSVSSKNPAPQSLLGIQLRNKKQTVQTPSNDMKQETNIRPSRPRRRQIRFAEVLAKPDSQISEI